MSRDVIMVGSTMRISLLYRGDYSQWRELFMNYLEEQTDGEAMINSIQNDEETSWIQEDSEIQERTSADTKILLDQEEPTELLEDLCSGEKGEK
nr:hypothetical protein [Tanacetum cinerariifolium]